MLASAPVGILRAWTREPYSTSSREKLLAGAPVSFLLRLLLDAALDRVDVHQGDRRPLDLVVECDIRPDAQRVPVAVLVLDLRQVRGQAVDDAGDQATQVADVKVRLDVADRPAH